MSRSLALLLITVLVLSSLVMVGSVFAQSIPKPSVPEFTVNYVDHSYYVPPTYGTAPYTGDNITIQGGYTVDNRSIEFTIKNQPFTPYNDANGNLISLYYHVHAKGHYEKEWGTPYKYINSSDSEYTIASYTMGEHSINKILMEITIGDTLDFQVEAQVGYYTRVYTSLYQSYYNFTGVSSGWSETQTLTIGESQTPTPSPATTPSPLPSPYEIPIIGVAFIVIVFAAGLGLLIYLIKRK